MGWCGRALRSGRVGGGGSGSGCGSAGGGKGKGVSASPSSSPTSSPTPSGVLAMTAEEMRNVNLLQVFFKQ